MDKKYVIVGKLLWYKMIETLWDMLLLKNNPLWGGNSNSWAASHPSIDYFSLTECQQCFIPY